MAQREAGQKPKLFGAVRTEGRRKEGGLRGRELRRPVESARRSSSESSSAERRATTRRPASEAPARARQPPAARHTAARARPAARQSERPEGKERKAAEGETTKPTPTENTPKERSQENSHQTEAISINPSIDPSSFILKKIFNQIFCSSQSDWNVYCN